MKPVYVVACVKKITVPQEQVRVTGLVVKTFILSEHPLAINFLHFYIFILHIHLKINLHIYCVWLHMCMCVCGGQRTICRNPFSPTCEYQGPNPESQPWWQKSLMCLATLPTFTQELVISHLFVSDRFINFF